MILQDLSNTSLMKSEKRLEKRRIRIVQPVLMSKTVLNRSVMRLILIICGTGRILRSLVQFITLIVVKSIFCMQTKCDKMLLAQRSTPVS